MCLELLKRHKKNLKVYMLENSVVLKNSRKITIRKTLTRRNTVTRKDAMLNGLLLYLSQFFSLLSFSTLFLFAVLFNNKSKWKGSLATKDTNAEDNVKKRFNQFKLPQLQWTMNTHSLQTFPLKTLKVQPSLWLSLQTTLFDK